MFWVLILNVILTKIFVISAQFEVPDATVEVFTPKGFRVSIPDQEGIKLFAFHGKINEDFNGREGGTFSQDVLKPKNGRWTFSEPYAKLKKGDVIYFWTYVDYFDGKNKLGYPRDEQSYVVNELVPKPGAQTTPPTAATTATTPSTPIISNSPSVPPRADTSDGSCEISQTTVRNKKTCTGKLIFSDTFTSGYKSKYWYAERKFATGPDYEFVMYQDHPQTLSIINNNLKIKPVLTDDVYGEDYVVSSSGLDLGDNCTGITGSPECSQKPEGWFILPPVMSAQISTKDKFSFKYGKIEIRAKLPKGDWVYPELFLNSENEEYGSGYESGQIRVAFTPGNDGLNRVLQGGVILGCSRAARNYGMKNIEKSSAWTRDYHRYGVIWRPDGITVSVDDKVYGNIYPPEGGFASLATNLQLTQYADRWKTGNKNAPFDKERYIAIGVGVGGHNFEDRSDGTKPWVNTKALSQKNFYKARSTWKATWNEKDTALDVDYVKVWAL